MPRRLLTIVLSIGAAAMVASGVVAPGASASGEPGSALVAPVEATPARTDAPVTVAVVGDSISQGTGSNGSGAPGGFIGSPRPVASWATGTHANLDSYTQRLSALSGEPVDTVNLSANGASVRDDFVGQVMRVPDRTDLVLVQMGGNDLCRSSESAMTPVDEFRSQVRTGLDWLSEHRPETLVMISSIPDVYALWYVRGAAHTGEQWPVLGFVVPGRDGPRAPRSTAENNNKRAARLLWHTLGVVPCETMLARPNVPRNAGPTPDPSHPDEQRRLRVRSHNIALNDVLADECAAILRCRFDDGAVFDLVSNRDADGVLLADKSQWTFVDADISTQDHFHPSFAGQRKLAAATWEAGYDWVDASPPVAQATLTPAATVEGPSVAGWYTGSVTVEVLYDDDTAVRGVEYRVHRPADTGDDRAAETPPWTPVHAERVWVEVSDEGVTWIESRALDVNGNLSESHLVPVLVDRAPPTALVTSPTDGASVVLGERVVARYDCDDDTSGVVSCAATAAAGRAVDTATVGTKTFSVEATDAAGHTATVEHRYHVGYGWSGTAPPLRPGEPREVRVGSALPVLFTLTDAAGNPVVDAEVEIVLVGADGRERPPTSALASIGLDRAVWSSAHGGHLMMVSTRGLRPGVWDVVIRPDDGSEHRVNVNLLDPADP